MNEVEELKKLLEQKDQQIEDLREKLSTIKKDVNTAAILLRKMHGVWGEAPKDLCPGNDLSRETWREEVKNQETSQGYWAWVSHKMESHGG